MECVEVEPRAPTSWLPT